MFYHEPAGLVDSLPHALGLRAKDLRNKLDVRENELDMYMVTAKERKFQNMDLSNIKQKEKKFLN